MGRLCASRSAARRMGRDDFANGRIAVSEGLAKQMGRSYRVTVSAIPNGIDPPLRVQSTAILEACGLAANRYALTVARIDETKRQLDLIAAYARLRDPTWKLALVGDADHSGSYARAVAEATRKTPGVVMLGHQTGENLAELYTHAGVFVLPSSHEGQPIAVLEAASFGLPVITQRYSCTSGNWLVARPLFQSGRYCLVDRASCLHVRSTGHREIRCRRTRPTCGAARLAQHRAAHPRLFISTPCLAQRAAGLRTPPRHER